MKYFLYRLDWASLMYLHCIFFPWEKVILKRRSYLLSEFVFFVCVVRLSWCHELDFCYQCEKLLLSRIWIHPKDTNLCIKWSNFKTWKKDTFFSWSRKDTDKHWEKFSSWFSLFYEFPKGNTLDVIDLPMCQSSWILLNR